MGHTHDDDPIPFNAVDNAVVPDPKAIMRGFGAHQGFDAASACWIRRLREKRCGSQQLSAYVGIQPPKIPGSG